MDEVREVVQESVVDDDSSSSAVEPDAQALALSRLSIADKRRASIDASEKQYIAALCWEKQLQAAKLHLLENAIDDGDDGDDGDDANDNKNKNDKDNANDNEENGSYYQGRRHTTTGIFVRQQADQERDRERRRRGRRSTACIYSDHEDESVQEYDDLGNPIESKDNSDGEWDGIDMTELRQIEKEYKELKRKRELEVKHRQWVAEILAQRHKKMAPFLPPEVVEVVFKYLDFPESTSCIYVCKTWYSVGVEALYREPKLNVYNYASFVNTISHSDVLGGLVKTLDLRNLVQSGKNSYTSRLLRRCSSSLQTFIAPQTSFGYAPLVSLKNCHQIRTLDLSLVSETVDLRALFSAIKNAQKLERLDFPRSSIYCHKYEDQWPANLWNLGLAGGISNDFMMDTTFPNTITHLSLSHCPFVTSEGVRSVAGRLGHHLVSFTAMFPLPALRPNALDSILKLCPKLRTLNVSVDYITRYIFADPNLPTDERGHITEHPLKYFHLDSSGGLGQARKLAADDISLAVLENKLPELSHVRISRKLGWDPSAEDMCELIEVLDDNGGGVWMV